jgi:hypothetical protein
VSSNFGYGIITWEIPYLFRTPPGIETDWATSSLSMKMEVARPFKSINFQKDEPIAQKHIIGWRRGAEARAIASSRALFTRNDQHRRDGGGAPGEAELARV